MKEQHKLKMVVDYEAGKVPAQQAAELLGVSERHFRRLVAAYRTRGVTALAHGNLGKTPVNCLPDAIRQKIVELAKSTYQDYNDCQRRTVPFVSPQTHRLGDSHKINTLSLSEPRFW